MGIRRRGLRLRFRVSHGGLEYRPYEFLDSADMICLWFNMVLATHSGVESTSVSCSSGEIEFRR